MTRRWTFAAIVKIPTWFKLMTAVLLTAMAAAADYIADINGHVIGQTQKIGLVAYLPALVFGVVAVMFWGNALVIPRARIASLLIVALSFCGFFEACLGAGFASDYFIMNSNRPDPYITNQVLEVANYGAATVTFAILMIGSVIALVINLLAVLNNTPKNNQINASGNS